MPQNYLHGCFHYLTIKMLYNRCTGIYKFGNNTYPRRIRRRSNLGHIFLEKKVRLMGREIRKVQFLIHASWNDSSAAVSYIHTAPVISLRLRKKLSKFLKSDSTQQQSGLNAPSLSRPDCQHRSRYSDSLGLDSPGIESRRGRGDFLYPSRPAPGPAQPPVQRVPG